MKLQQSITKQQQHKNVLTKLNRLPHKGWNSTNQFSTKKDPNVVLSRPVSISSFITAQKTNYTQNRIDRADILNLHRERCSSAATWRIHNWSKILNNNDTQSTDESR